jgi:hypothetical protein
MKSWKTTALGILTVLGALSAAGLALLDGDPETVPNWTAVGTAITAGVGLIFARDNDRRSEDVGARPR